MKIVLALAALFAFQACTSNDHEVRDVETLIEKKGRVGDKDIGINKDGEAIIQEKVEADDELRRQQWTNNVLTEKFETEHFELRRCRTEISDPRLGGDGNVREIPEIDNMASTDGVKEEFGADEQGDLKVVRREYYLERLNQERKVERKLRDMLKTVSKYREDCGRKLSHARVRSGLPANRYTAKGYYSGDGTWVETRKAELTLDDAFEIKSMESKRGVEP